MASLLVAPKPFYEIQGDMAASEQQQQAVEINKIKIEQARQQMADDASVKALQQQAYNMNQGQDQQQPQAQQPDITQQAKQPTQQQLPQQQPVPTPQGAKSPNGQVMPSFMGGPQQEAAGKQPASPPGVNTPDGYKQEPGQDQQQGDIKDAPIIEQLKHSQKGLDSIDQAIKINDQAIQLAYKSNNPGAAQRLLAQNQELKTSKTDAAIKQMTLAQKSMEMFGQIANGYKGAYNQWLKDNPNASVQEKQDMSDKLWAQTITEAQAKGVPADGLFNFHTPDQRNQYATGIIDSAEKVSDQVRLTIADLNNKTKIQLQNQKDELTKRRIANTEKWTNAKIHNLDAKTQAMAGQEVLKDLRNQLTNATQLAKNGDEGALKEIPLIQAEMSKVEGELKDLDKNNKIDAPKEDTEGSPTIDTPSTEEKKPAEKTKAPVKVTSPTDPNYIKLKPGDHYIGPDGKERIKK